MQISLHRALYHSCQLFKACNINHSNRLNHAIVVMQIAIIISNHPTLLRTTYQE